MPCLLLLQFLHVTATKEEKAIIFKSMASASCVNIFSGAADSSLVGKQCKEKRNYFARFLLLCLHDQESTRLSFPAYEKDPNKRKQV